MNSDLKARDIMIDTVISLTPEMTLQHAWECLFENKISGAPVVDRAGVVVGVLSQTDLVRETFSEGLSDFPKNSYYLDVPFYNYSGDGWKQLTEKLSSLRVEDSMTRDPVSVSADDSVVTMARMMRRHHVHRLIVTDEKKLVGIVTSLDLLRIIEIP